MKITRLIYFQSIWFLIIYFGKIGLDSYAFLMALVSILIDYKLFQKDIGFKPWLVFISTVLASGILIDSLLLNTNMVVFKSTNGYLSPLFMWGMWLIFTPYYQIGFEKLHSKKLLSSVLAFIFAPISYYSGVKQGALTIDSLYNLIAVGALWAVFFAPSISLYVKVKKWKNSSSQQ